MLPVLRRKALAAFPTEGVEERVSGRNFSVRTVKSLALDGRQRHDGTSASRLRRSRVLTRGEQPTSFKPSSLPLELLMVTVLRACRLFALRPLQRINSSIGARVRLFSRCRTQLSALPAVHFLKLLQQYDERSSRLRPYRARQPPRGGAARAGIPLLRSNQGRIEFEYVRCIPLPRFRPCRLRNGVSVQRPEGTINVIMGRRLGKTSTVTRLLRRCCTATTGPESIAGNDVAESTSTHLRPGTGCGAAGQFSLFSRHDPRRPTLLQSLTASSKTNRLCRAVGWWQRFIAPSSHCARWL